MFPPDELAARGSDSIFDCFASLGREMPGARLALTEENFRSQGDGFASWGLWDMHVPGPRGGMTMRGRYTETMIREDGRLVLLVDHASVPVQKSEPPPRSQTTHVKKSTGKSPAKHSTKHAKHHN